jgi:asparagine synthase (glutamine-hydrolysing)
MCGISGFFTKEEFYTKDDLVKITSAISHRGPDASGYYYDGQVGLGHRRLSILDLSDAANQPFFAGCGNYVIVFNGEVYNYQELIKELSVPLRTTSDTEVILELFIKEGPEFVHKLNGMFAFVIYDIKLKKIFLYRDRLGVKPLFYYNNNDTFIFSSEIKSILAVQKGIDKQMRLESISHFLHLGYIPEPLSIYTHIQKFPAGHYASVSKDDFQITQYWNPEKKVTPYVLTEEKEAKEKLHELLQSSIRYRMISDVPFGAFLSGGIDSSLVSAIAHSQSKNPLKTFSIGFKEAKFNESDYAKKVALHLGTDHHEFILSEKDAKQHLLEVIEHFDEPFMDTSALPTYLVSKMASKHVKVVLTGDGGDELFMGYGAYPWAERLNTPWIRSTRKIINFLLSNTSNSRYKRAAHLFNYNKEENINSHIFSQEQYLFSQKELNELLLKEQKNATSISYHTDSTARKLSPSEKQALFDIKYYLKDDLLVKVDRMTMLASIEGREPLLDYRIVEFALNLSQELKIKNGCSKYLLKQILYDYIPESFFDRPKQGFAIPLSIWLKTDLRFLINENLLEEKIKKTNVVDYNYVKKLIQRFDSGDDYLFNRIWMLIILQRFLLKRC